MQDVDGLWTRVESPLNFDRDDVVYVHKQKLTKKQLIYIS